MIDNDIQKAEIERLQSMCQTLSECRDEALRAGVKAVRNAKSEAIKEFAERLKTYAKELHIGDDISWLVLGVGRVDNLVKEMTEVEINQRKEDEGEMKELLERKLQEKKKQLAHRKEIFKIMVENEIDIGNFERNAISDLMLMFELKTEIKELENIIPIYNAYHPTEKGGGQE